MTTIRSIYGCILCLATISCIGLLTSVSAGAGNNLDTFWKVEGDLIGKKKKGKKKKSEDVSGIACATDRGFPRTCLLIDDELQVAQVVIVQEGSLLAGGPVPLIDDTFDGEPVEFDGEGVAYADGEFLVIGSHGHPRDQDNELDPDNDADEIRASITANSRIIRVRIDPGTVAPDGKLRVKAETKAFTDLRAILADEPLLAPFVDRRLDQNGLTIEGIAVVGETLYVGLRAPSLGGDRAAIVSMAVKAFLDGGKPKPQLHLVPLGPGRGVRDLAASPSGLLVLAGPAAATDGPYSIYRVKGDDAVLLGDVPPLVQKGEAVKPEALLFLNEDQNGQRVLVLSDGAKNGAPRELRIRRVP
jgi:Protein of unknown function (DUF3616)